MTGKRPRGFYCTREERSAIGTRAAAAGTSVSRLVLDLVHDDMAEGPVSGLTAEEMAELLDGLRVLAAYVRGLLRDGTADAGAPRTVPGIGGRHHGDVGDRDCGTPAERVRLSVSATDAEWAAVHERARRSGLSISRYLGGLLLPEATIAGPHSAPLPALSGVEQREVLEAVRHMRSLLFEAGAPGAGSTGTPDRVAALPDPGGSALAEDGREERSGARPSASPDGGHVETDDAGPDPDAPDQGALF